MDTLRLSVLTPHSYANGCRCRECLGFAEYMRGLTGKDYGLEGPLKAVPAPLTPVDPCAGTMVCDCPKCTQERSQRVQRPPRAAPQPWESKAA